MSLMSLLVGVVSLMSAERVTVVCDYKAVSSTDRDTLLEAKMISHNERLYNHNVTVGCPIDNNICSVPSDAVSGYAIMIKGTEDTIKLGKEMRSQTTYELIRGTYTCAIHKGWGDERIVSLTTETPSVTYRSLQSITTSLNRSLVEFGKLRRKYVGFNYEPAGYLTVKFTVNPAGDVFSAVVLKSTTDNASLDKDFVNLLMNIKFGMAGDKVVEAQYTFDVGGMR